MTEFTTDPYGPENVAALMAAMKRVRELRKAGRDSEAGEIVKQEWPHLYSHFFEGEARRD